jgi:hypothetical protein
MLLTCVTMYKKWMKINNNNNNNNWPHQDNGSIVPQIKHDHCHILSNSHYEI